MEAGHVVLFPFMAQGHIIPFQALARLIEQRKRCTITLVNTPLNINRFKSSLPHNTSIHLAELPFSSAVHGLPPDVESLEALPFSLFHVFFHATETLQPSFEQLIGKLIEQHDRDQICIIADSFLGWTVESAQKLGIFHTVFMTNSAYGSAIIISLWLHPPSDWDCADEVALIDFPEVRIQHSQITNTLISTDGIDPMSTFIRRQLSLCIQSNGLLVNTVEGFETVGLSLLRRSPGLPVWSVGPLIRRPLSFNNNAGEFCIELLDSKPKASVLYVSFGSQNTIKAWEMMQLAMGLEASGKPFIWVIRPPVEFDAAEEFRTEWLPQGFEERMREKQQGLVVHKWAPQMEILSHGSTGAFLSHCGWNSVMESLIHGVPIIGWPLLADQLYNSKMLDQEMGVCVEVARGRNAHGLERGWEGVKAAINIVMGETKKGRDMRKKACEIKEMIRGALREDEILMGSSLKAMDDFLKTAFSTRKQTE